MTSSAFADRRGPGRGRHDPGTGGRAADLQGPRSAHQRGPDGVGERDSAGRWAAIAHANEDEAWNVLEGELRFRLGADLRGAPAGTFVFVPRDTPHCFQNIGRGAAQVLVLFTPSGMERFFDRFASLPEGPNASEAFSSIGREVGMEVIGPPLAVSDPPAARA